MRVNVTYLAHIRPLVPVLQVFDDEGPLLLGWPVVEAEPRILGEDLVAHGEDVPVAAADPRDLEKRELLFV